MNQEQFRKVQHDDGFIAALDQSGGSTPRALAAYGIGEDAYTDDDQMFHLMHAMRARIMTSSAFDGARILGAILFEDTMDRKVEGQWTPEYLWDVKGVVPFLKVDKGLEAEASGVQLMKPIPDLDDLLGRAVERNVFGTKMRSVIKMADASGIDAIVAQQFEIGDQILVAGLIPILEPEVDIHSPEKAEAEELLKAGILQRLDRVADGHQVMLKLTIPSSGNHYREVIDHPSVLRVVALSGGYSRDDANERLARNDGMIASFSRALTEGLSAQQSDEEFDAALDTAIASIFAASVGVS